MPIQRVRIQLLTGWREDWGGRGRRERGERETEREREREKEREAVTTEATGPGAV